MILERHSKLLRHLWSSFTIVICYSAGHWLCHVSLSLSTMRLIKVRIDLIGPYSISASFTGQTGRKRRPERSDPDETEADRIRVRRGRGPENSEAVLPRQVHPRAGVRHRRLHQQVQML